MISKLLIPGIGLAYEAKRNILPVIHLLLGVTIFETL